MTTTRRAWGLNKLGFDWKKRYGKAKEHNALLPRDHWVEADKQQLPTAHV